MVKCFICSKEIYKQSKALEGSKSGKLFCTKSCQTKWRNAEFKDEKHPNWKGGLYAYRRMMKQSSAPQMCTLCKIKDKRVLAVHHVDENRKNNNIDNLQWLCHNCHHLVHHHSNERERFMAAMV
jgi:5-methylcytosine-specific restriction endonuclease McrA